jgi:transcriptional regulator with XRE-family HTH domain
MPQQFTSVPALINAIKGLGMTQSQIATNLNVSPAMVTFWKQGTSVPSAEHLPLLRSLFDGLSKAQTASPISSVETSYSEWLEDRMAELNVSPASLANQAGINIMTLNLILSGKTQNPQKGTREKIEAALRRLTQSGKSKPPFTLAAPVPTEDEPHIGIPFSKEEIKGAPNKIGVYVIHDRRGFPTYIGSGNIMKRLKDHFERKAFSDERVASSFSYILLEQEDSDRELSHIRDEARRWERIIIKFSGSSVLLNNALREGLNGSDDEWD